MKLNFTRHPLRQYLYEQYFNPRGLEFAPVYNWCGRTFGLPGTLWDYHGGWIKLKSEKELMLFTLRWA
jgi:hypothetical protein